MLQPVETYSVLGEGCLETTILSMDQSDRLAADMRAHLYSMPSLLETDASQRFVWALHNHEYVLLLKPSLKGTFKKVFLKPDLGETFKCIHIANNQDPFP